MYGAYRDTEPGHQYWRIALYMFPMYFVPPGIQARVPMDDEHTLTFMMSRRRGSGSPLGMTAEQLNDPDYARWKTGVLPNTTDWLGRFRAGSNLDNDFEIDLMIIRTRRRILNVIDAHEKGLTPPGVDDPDVFAVRSAQLLLPSGADWIEATQEYRKAFGPLLRSEMARS